MKNSFMKLNHVSTFSGKGQVEIGYGDMDFRLGDFRKKSSFLYRLLQRANAKTVKTR